MAQAAEIPSSKVCASQWGTTRVTGLSSGFEAVRAQSMLPHPREGTEGEIHLGLGARARGARVRTQRSGSHKRAGRCANFAPDLAEAAMLSCAGFGDDARRDSGE